MPTERGTKQVIVMRTDLNMRKDKMVAQGAHASLMTALRARDTIEESRRTHHWTPAYDNWITGSFTKVCVGVDSEEALLGILEAAALADIPAYLINDAGRTEFHGVPTRTCLAIGPWWSDEIDRITGELRLL